jgi:hypothetical protein
MDVLSAGITTLTVSQWQQSAIIDFRQVGFTGAEDFPGGQV